MARQIVTLYGVAETYRGTDPYVVVAVRAEVYKTGYKIRYPDLDPDRIHAMRAFRHDNWLWRNKYDSNESHLMTVAGAIEHFLAKFRHDIESAQEQLTELRVNQRCAKKLFACHANRTR